jgi:DNA-directed RNA polymerase subunit RPC12/RpoP
LSNKGTLVHLQCPDCGHLWSIDTRDRAIRRFKAA